MEPICTTSYHPSTKLTPCTDRPTLTGGWPAGAGQLEDTGPTRAGERPSVPLDIVRARATRGFRRAGSCQPVSSAATRAVSGCPNLSATGARAQPSRL